MAWAFRAFLAIESVRLLGWLALVWISGSASPGEHAEAVIFVVIPVNILGFPYSWLAAMASGSWDLLAAPDFNMPFRIVLAHFALWCVITGAIALFWKSSIAARVSSPPPS